MFPVLIIALVWWAGAGAVATIKAARAGDTATAAAQPAAAGPPPPDSITFGQWQRAAYSRWKKRIRSAIPGRHLGRRASDLIGDITAAAIAGAAVFGFGFASGTVWIGGRRAGRGARQRLRPNAGTPGPGTAPRGFRFRAARPSPTARPASGPNPAGGPGRSRGPGAPQNPNTPPQPGPQQDNGVVDAEIIDDAPAAQPPVSQYGGAEDAEIIYAQLTASSPDTPNGHDMASEILTIHHLISVAKEVIAHTAEAAGQSLVRASSALERAGHALVRSKTASTRAAGALVLADQARTHAVQLQETAARFQVLRMDPASLASMGEAIAAAAASGQAEQRRAEAAAVTAAKAAELAAAEQNEAEASDASAKAAQRYAETVQIMHDTVIARQMPHAEAQAATGNAAAHASVLAAS